MGRQTNRREFFRRSAVAGATSTFLLSPAPAPARIIRPLANDKVRFASIGVGGKGDSDSSDAGKLGELVAICDINDEFLEKKAKQFPDAKKYYDYRKMLEDLGDKIDAVTVSTPDHSHAPASVMAMNLKKHCFTQKPLTWSVEEARYLRKLASDNGLCTQMGNQGTSHDGFRQGVALLQSDMLGQIKEIHVWTNRPIWPQGMKRPDGTPGIPNNVRWYEFLGPAHDRPYHSAYQPFNWRGWLDFGTGALGDMACHTLNVAAMALELFDPESVEVVDTSGIVDNASYPTWSIIRTHFGSTDKRGPITMTWYDGGEKLPKDKRPFVEMIEGEKVPGSGLLVVGTEGKFFSHNDYGAEHVLLPRDKFKGKDEPESKMPKSPGHFQEFIDAIQANDPSKAFSNFGYSGRLTETVLLGVVALRAGGKIEWDADNMKVTNNTDANQYLRREYRKGFSIH